MSFWKDLNVSRETFSRLEAYKDTLLLWNSKVNLISVKSADDVWFRHFLDSAQIFKNVTEADRHILDMGSGGGLPGLVLAIISKEKYPSLKITLVEADKRKAAFLQEIVRTQRLNSAVIPERIEKVPILGADIVTARALAPLNVLLGYAYRHIKNNGRGIFLKGVSYNKEVEEALDYWNFNIKVDASITNPGSAILKIRDLEQKNGA